MPIACAWSGIAAALLPNGRTVCSRFADYKENGINRLQSAGVQITNRESILFEWMRDNTHPNFREIVKNLIA